MKKFKNFVVLSLSLALLFGNLQPITATLTWVVAVNDVITILEDAEATDILVLANDTINDHGKTRESVNVALKGPSPTHGVLTLEGHVFRYTPGLDRFDDVSFEYTVTVVYSYRAHGNKKKTCTESASARVNITITPVNDPLFAVDDNAQMDEDTSVDVDVLANDSDPDNEDFWVTGFGESDDVVVSINDDGTVRLVPRANFNGGTSVVYYIGNDAGDVAHAVIYITVYPVNDGPVAVDDSRSTLRNVPINIDVMVNDYDVDGDPFYISDFDESSLNGGTVGISESGEFLIYTPPTGFIGTDTFEYTIEESWENFEAYEASISEISDRRAAIYEPLSDSAVVTVTVSAPPVVPVPPSDPIIPTPSPTLYTLTVSSTSGGSVPGFEGINNFSSGTNVNLSLIPEEGYEFVGWTGDTASMTGNVIVMTGNYAIVANFAIIQPVVEDVVIEEPVIPEEDIDFDEEALPEAVPEAIPLEEVVESAVILDEVTPLAEGEATLPTTSGLPIAIPLISGIIFTLGGFKLRKISN